MTDQRYCTECGRELSPGDRFCPSCGANIPEDEYWGEVPEGAVVSTACVEDRSGTLNIVKIMCILWAAVAVFSGICCLACLGMMDSIIDELSHEMMEDGTQTVWEYLTSNGFDRGFLEAVFIVVGAMMLLTGAAAGVTAALCHMRIHYKAALACLVVSIVFSGMGLVCLVVGIVVLVYLTKCRCEFVS